MSRSMYKRWPGPWTGPRDDEIDGAGKLRAPVPPERWPYGLLEAHERCCLLHEGGLYCDCAASDASSWEHGARA